MSITLTSTHNKSNGKHTINLTKHIVNLFSNILSLDSTATDLYIPDNINEVLSKVNGYIMEEAEVPIERYTNLYKLFGIKRTVMTPSELNEIEGYSYSTETKDLTISGKNIINEFDIIPIGVAGLIVEQCDSLVKLSITVSIAVYVRKNDALVDLYIRSADETIVEFNKALTDLVIETNYSTLITNNNSLINLCIRLNIHDIESLPPARADKDCVTENALLNNNAYVVKEDGTRIYSAINQSPTELIKQLVQTLQDYLTSNEQ